jgi:hypothetical protein
VIFQNTEQTLLNPNFNLPPDSDQFALFRIVANGLGKLTYRSTLRESIQLASDPATVALREHLAAWEHELGREDADAALKIQTEIKRATDALAKLQPAETVGTVTTWLSVPISTVEFIFGLPPILGCTVGLVEKGASATSKLLARKHRWAMYGNT